MKSRLSKFATSSGLIILAAVIAAFTKESLNGSALDIQSALAEGKISANPKMTGTYSDKSVQLDLSNKSASQLRINVPSGTIFKPLDDGEQALITITDQVIVLQPKSQNTITLDAYCSEAGDRCPAAGGKCSIGTVADPKLKKLLAELKNVKVSKSIVQDAIWTVTDGHSVSNIDHVTPGDRQLRSFVATLTGQKDVWYSTPQNRTVDQLRNIVSETVTIKGNISYTATKGAMIYNEVAGESGNSIHRTEAKAAPYNGKVEFTFTIRVKGWEKGKYSVRVKEGERLIAEYPFSI